MGGTSASESLTIVIPALNEEEAIGSTVARSLEARRSIQEEAKLDTVEIIVVSDGSTDRTAEIARGFEDVRVIVFEENRGYGAAIKEGFRQGSGSMLAFLDADGTCDPQTFGRLCRAVIEQDADIALGSRLGPGSQMPAIRKLGNRVYAFLLGLLCGHAITDIASGMRVIRRGSLDILYPLPDGLHFTPAMSARALLNDLRVLEIPMSYEERIGTSKLSVVADGLRFLWAIVGGVLCYRPERLFLIGFTLCFLFSALLAAYPTEFYVKMGYVEEWMVYRFLACFLLGSAGYLLLCAGVLAHHMAYFGPRRHGGTRFWPALLARAFRGKLLGALTAGEVVLSVFLLWPGIVEYVTTGEVYLHWSRVVVGAFGLLIAFQSLVTGVLLQVVEVWKEQHAFSRESWDGQESRTRN